MNYEAAAVLAAAVKCQTSDDSSMESQSVVVRFAGDSGDGVQLMGTQFVAATALAGDDFATFPDYPAEIRAPGRHDVRRVRLPDPPRRAADHDGR